MRLRALCWVLLAAQLSRADDAVASLKSFTGPMGQRVEVGPLDTSRVVLRFSGTDSELDGRALAASATTSGTERGFVTRLHGSDFTLLRLTDSSGTVFLPGGRTFAVKFEKTGGPADAQALRNEHQRQLADGTLGLLSRREFPFLQKKYDGLARTALAEVNRACHSNATFTFDWARIPDEVMENIDVWKRCAPLFDAARTRCPTEAAWVCSFGPAADLERVEGRLVFTTTREGDVSSFLSKHLEKKR